MSRAEDLAMRFEQANVDVIAAVEACTEEQWRKQCAGEGWGIGVVAHHIAGAYPTIAGIAQGIATGQELPSITMEMIDHGNAQHANEFANCTKAEVLELLRSNGASAAGAVQGMSEAQLDKAAPLGPLGPDPVSAQQVIENILIGHAQGHLQSIQATTGGH